MSQRKVRKNQQYDRFSDELTVLGLSMAYQERDGTAPRKTVAGRALELRGYEGNAGKQQIRRTMYSLGKTVGEFRFIELISEKKNPTRIRFLKRENEAMRTISSRRFLSKHKVGNGGISYTELGDKIGVEYRTVRRWAIGERAIQPKYWLKLLDLLEPDQYQTDLAREITAAIIACEPLHFANELIELGFSPDEIWKASKVAHPRRLTQMGIGRKDVEQLPAEIDQINRYLNQITGSLRSMENRSLPPHLRGQERASFNRQFDALNQYRKRSKMFNACFERTKELLDDWKESSI